MPNVESVEETFNCLSEKKSLVRFGDGEIIFLTDRMDLPFQNYESELAENFEIILANKTHNLSVGLPTGYYSLKNMEVDVQNFWKSQIVWNYGRFKKYLNKDSRYANASITRLYYGMKDKGFAKMNFCKWKNVLTADTAIIIEGEKTRFGIGNDLLNNVSSIKRILGPKHHAFSRASDIIEFVKKMPKPDLILVALGPAAKFITFHLHLAGYWVIDIGNLDIEYEWYLRGATERIPIPGKYTSEAKGGREVADIVDSNYESQIIANFL